MPSESSSSTAWDEPPKSESTSYVTAWDAPAETAPAKQESPSPVNPYIRRIYSVNGIDDDGKDAEDLLVLQTPRHQFQAAELTLPPTIRNKIRVYPFPFLHELNDKLFLAANTNNPGLQEQEYPRHYFVVDDRIDKKIIENVESYLRSQKTLSMALHVVQCSPIKEKNLTIVEGDAEMVCVMVATRFLTVLFDTFTLDADACFSFLKSIVEDPKIVKVVNNYADQSRYLENGFSVQPRNFYDVSQAESFLDGKQSAKHFGLAEFRSRYRKQSSCFENFSMDQFIIEQVNLTRKDGSLRELNSHKITQLLKKVIFLQVIRRIQVQELHSKIITEQEKIMMGVYTYVDATNFSMTEDPAWQTPVDYFTNETRNAIGGLNLNVNADGQANLAEQIVEEDEEFSDEDVEYSQHSSDSETDGCPW